MTLCYFAHPISEYGTAKQKKAIAFIKRMGFSVLNPDTIAHQVGYKAAGVKGMDYFVNLVKKCNALAFLRFPDGTIGAGVGLEIKTAFDTGLPVYEIEFEDERMDLTLMHNMPIPILSVTATREKLKQYR